ncbi:calcium/sodium antiporter [Pontixanthobacter aestiaquae]|uniref:calcium/sodium antiporter n=1 Tax=Pontixanthobacter aestiaquae TaxID=1509367 RepID=UPI0025B418BE|nr:calcium/sodium antiporter [Pontixanthobacter aestiaquae]MDN3646047.1 calcium/sodium antiporter [Pontixanthobacter aestiaquae]
MIGGLILLAIGGELLVRGALGVSRLLKISPMLAGLTIVGFGTSMPELATSVQAALAGSPGIALGNIIGSNIANILLILGVSALILPLAVNRQAFLRDSVALGGATMLCVAAVLVGTIGWMIGVIFALALCAYLVWAYRSEKDSGDAEETRHAQEAGDAAPATTNITVPFAMVIGGLAAAVYGAGMLVEGATVLAVAAGVSETVIGLTVVAIGTSLPELVACLVAVMKRHPDVAIGNVVGSNIYNLLGILGLTAMIHPLSVPAEIARFDIWVMAGVTALMLVQLRSGWKVARAEGGLLVCLFAAYTTFLVMR